MNHSIEFKSMPQCATRTDGVGRFYKELEKALDKKKCKEIIVTSDLNAKIDIKDPKDSGQSREWINTKLE